MQEHIYTETPVILGSFMVWFQPFIRLLTVWVFRHRFFISHQNDHLFPSPVLSPFYSFWFTYLNFHSIYSETWKSYKPISTWLFGLNKKVNPYWRFTLWLRHMTRRTGQHLFNFFLLLFTSKNTVNNTIHGICLIEGSRGFLRTLHLQ